MGWNQEQLRGFALTDWLLDAGSSVAKKSRTSATRDGLGSTDRLLYEFWIFDMEQQNGGVSQYFLNRPVLQASWHTLSTLSRTALPSFNSLASKIDSIISNHPDTHEAFHDLDQDLDGMYEAVRVAVLEELQNFVGSHS